VSLSADLLREASWECAACSPGSVADPGALAQADLSWLAASVPGTAAGALRAAGEWSFGAEDEQLLDGQDWWFRCRFAAAAAGGAGELRLGGLATIADVWLNTNHLLHSENMWLSHRVALGELDATNELVLRFAALTPLLARRHPRPRWKSLPLRSQSLRWYRTTAQGRLPDFARWAAPVGPWRPVALLQPLPQPELIDLQLAVRCLGEGGAVELRAIVRTDELESAQLRVGDELAPLSAERDGETVVLSGTLALARVERWWPHSHGEQPLYPARLELDGVSLPLRPVGFRTVEVRQEGGAFTLLVNGLPIFCRGATWGGADPVTFSASPEAVGDLLRRARDAGMNMLRVAGYSAYPDESFWDACDELGLLVWQDCMLTSVDPPEDGAFWSGYERELRQVFGALQGRPSLALACGGTEIYQQAAMFGLPLGSWRSALIEETVPALLAELIPDVPYTPTTPSGGELPFHPDTGTCHYFGIGAYLHPLADARLARVRFASECLAFGIPPEPETVDECFGGARLAGHDPRWKATVTRDPAMSWDYEDVTNHYVKELFGVEALSVRYSDPERALDLGRAAVCESMSVVLSDWRRRDSPCEGALILGLRDGWPGSGWGLIDARGRAKAPWYAVARVFAPRCVLLTDDRLSGLHLHVVNDRPLPLRATVRLSVFDPAGALSESAEQKLTVPGHDLVTLSAQAMLGGFRDLTYAFRFAPARSDVVWVELISEEGELISDAYHLPGGPARPLLPDVGLEAALEQAAAGRWRARISTRAFAQYVALELPGFVPSDSWFHLAPGATRTVELSAREATRAPAGSVRALNSLAKVRLRREPEG
jgi:beta-mannosidase